MTKMETNKNQDLTVIFVNKSEDLEREKQYIITFFKYWNKYIRLG